MQPFRIALFAALLVHTSHAETLTDTDRELLLERLEKIQKEADSTADARFRGAVSAFNSAMASNDAAIDLYLKCEEKVNFEEMKRKSSDFREWKRSNSDKLSDFGFRMALRQQLRWLVLTLEAASEKPDRDKLAMEAAKIVESIVGQAEELLPHRSVLQQAVTGSVFARAYDINGLKVEEWPLAPAQIDAIYDQVLLPPLRRPDRIPSLRAAWQKRMVHESVLADQWSRSPGGNTRSGERAPEYDKFVSDKLPRLRWEAEVDAFKAGDERAGALRMLKHIEENLSHEAAPTWASEFSGLLQGIPAVAPEDQEPEENGSACAIPSPAACSTSGLASICS